MSDVLPSRPKELESEDSLASYFDRSASTVRSYTSRFENDYARPLLNICKLYFGERPISATFVATFFLLSTVPILSFLLSSILAVAAFVITALIAVFLASTFVILLLVSLLCLTLIAIAFISAFLTVFAISAYFSIRLLLLVRQHGAPGISGWLEEVKHRILGIKSKTPPKQTLVNGAFVPGSTAATIEKSEPSTEASHSSVEKKHDQ